MTSKSAIATQNFVQTVANVKISVNVSANLAKRFKLKNPTLGDASKVGFFGTL